MKRGRGRPSLEDGAVLSRDKIVHRALELAGSEGFVALSMNRLAKDLDVTPKALYNHVQGRQDVIDAVAALMMQQLPHSRFDPDDWRESLREAYREGRDVYRRFPRALLISMDEVVTPAELDSRRIDSAEQMLRFFVEVGLSLDQAVAIRAGFLTDLLGFVLTIDYRYDAGDELVRSAVSQPVPKPWLDAHPGIDAPLSRQVAESGSLSSDEMFERFIDLRVAAVEALLRQG